MAETGSHPEAAITSDPTGREAFLNGKYEEAQKIWSIRLKSVRLILSKNAYTGTTLEEIKQEEIQTLQNLAQCAFKLEHFSESVQYCNEVLSKSPKHQKAHYRKIQALIEMGEFGDAKKQVDLWQSVDSSQSVIRKELTQRIVQRENQYKRDSKRLANRMVQFKKATSKKSLITKQNLFSNLISRKNLLLGTFAACIGAASLGTFYWFQIKAQM